MKLYITTRFKIAEARGVQMDKARVRWSQSMNVSA